MSRPLRQFIRAGLIISAAVVLALGAASCGPSGDSAAPVVSSCVVPVLPAPSAAARFPVPAENEFTVMTFNLNQYVLFDRDRDPETLEPKPADEIAAVIDVIRQVSPDILNVQEIGDPAVWDDFKRELRDAGLADYHYEEYLRRDPNDRNIALLSRFPIVSRQSHTDDQYTIGPRQFPVRRGILDVELEIRPEYRLRVMAAHLKSKVFHDFGQAEMRRNEARLLCNHVRAAIKENPQVNLLVMGDMNDTPGSAPIREITTYQDRQILFDLRPLDDRGDAWTYRGSDDRHERLDYFFVNDQLLPEVVRGKTYIPGLTILAAASDHRPLVATFIAEDRDSKAAEANLQAPAKEFQMDD